MDHDGTMDRGIHAPTMDRGIHAPVPFLAHPCARLTPRAFVQDKEILIWL